MKVILITGMSGAGKSVALNLLEDSGFEAIDNIPLALLDAAAGARELARPLALGVDIRSRDFSSDKFLSAIAPLQANPDIELSVIYLDCDNEVLRRRYTETRRRHPLALDRAVEDGLALERELIGDLKNHADLVIDTTDMQASELKRLVAGHCLEGKSTLQVSIVSFSFKRGIPREADNVFDVRFLKNPHYNEALRPLTGMDEKVGAFIEKDPAYKPFMTQMESMLALLLPRYREEGKSYLTLAIGCTGGRHRSIHVAQAIGGFLRELGYNVTIRHRDTEIE